MPYSLQAFFHSLVATRLWLAHCILLLFISTMNAEDTVTLKKYKEQIEPLIDKYCAGCHSAESKKGGISFESEDLQLLMNNKEVWGKALKMVRAELMPPRGKAKPTPDELKQLENWIKYSAFAIDPKNIDPGQVTLHRLNRTEYRNTIRDLLGVDYNTTEEFPADDSGHGFDNISAVLTMSPLLLEKYLTAAKKAVGEAIPTRPLVPAEKQIAGKQFTLGDGKPDGKSEGSLTLSYYKNATVRHIAKPDLEGSYQLVFDLSAHETYVEGQFDYNKCKVTIKADDKTLLTQEFSRQGGKSYRFEYDLKWQPGDHELRIELEPLTPKEKQIRNLNLRINSVTLRGPLEEKHWVRPAKYEKWFKAGIPIDMAQRRIYLRTILKSFVDKAYRRPVDEATVERLVKLVETIAGKPGQTFEAGIAQAMTVILASPRFLYREEFSVGDSIDKYPLLDEYSLASRLSYFLWSSMPDDELLQQAGKNQLRNNLTAQVKRMLADKRSSEFVRHFTGQWLQIRAIENANVNAFAVLSKDEVPDPKAQEKRTRFRELNRKPFESLTAQEKKELEEARASFFAGFRRFSQFELNGDLRRALRLESEMHFDHLLKNNLSLLELIDCDYAFLNERLAKQYGIEGVKGDQMRKVILPPGNPRGGILTQGAVLIVTSNPDRTSPVKRGLYLLENILGTPTPPPPPDITTLEAAAAKVTGKPPTLRESLKLHRADAKCASCHSRMDPIGLAFENFNALGRWRDKELNQPIEAAGELITGEGFKNVQELKRILVTTRRMDYYHCVTEKMFIYALGRGMEHHDQETIDEIAHRLEASKGSVQTLISGIIESPAFQRRRQPAGSVVTQPAASRN